MWLRIAARGGRSSCTVATTMAARRLKQGQGVRVLWDSGRWYPGEVEKVSAGISVAVHACVVGRSGIDHSLGFFSCGGGWAGVWGARTTRAAVLSVGGAVGLRGVLEGEETMVISKSILSQTTSPTTTSGQRRQHVQCTL